MVHQTNRRILARRTAQSGFFGYFSTVVYCSMILVILKVIKLNACGSSHEL